MSGTNHITGGIVFTGVFASFWDVNIFSSPWLLFFSAFFSVLPDVDHTRSPIGKLFYPLAKYLDRKFGHRTITHSLICYLGLFALIRIIENIAGINNNASFIYSFAYASHLIFDMMTKQGVPLLYPFKRNACVIPANPQLRLKSSDFKTETIIFCFFIIIGITCQPLFAQGFWTSFNNSFGTLMHLTAEFNKSENLIELEYNYNHLGTNHKGKGYVLSATHSKAFIFDKKNIIQILDEDKLISMKAVKTKQKFSFKELYFFDVAADSLHKIIKGKPIQNLKIQSSSKIKIIKDNKPTISENIDLEYCINPTFTFIDDSINVNEIKKLQLLKYDLQEELKKLNYENTDRYKTNDRIDFLNTTIVTMDNYEREKATIELQQLQEKAKGFKPIDTNIGKLLLQINQIDEELHTVKRAKITGYISYFEIDDIK
ncbi:MAG: metal-dependent hydrolase [Bacteroidota bacterium]